MTTDARIQSATRSFLDCMARRGGQCVNPHPAVDAWLALGELGMLENVPGPLVPNKLIASARQIRSPEWFRKAVNETARAAKRAKDLSCRPATVRDASADFEKRGKRLVRIAERLGLASTVAGPPTGKLATELSGFGGVRIVHARCNKGAIFVLVAAPRRAIDPDEDPRAHPSGGWEAVLASTDLVRLQEGAPVKAIPVAIPADRSSRDGIDPWMPLTEQDI